MVKNSEKLGGSDIRRKHVLGGLSLKTAVFAIAAAAVMVLMPSTASAGTTTGTLAASATIANTCHYNSGTMSFGPYDPIVTNAATALSVTGTISLTCTINDSLTMTANAGANSSHASGACATATCSRAMASGTNYLSYDLYTTSGHTTVWNATNSIADTVTGSMNQSLSVYGYIPAAIADPAGSYSDSVTVTVTF
jgi:spore coat protein U-like protein